MLWIPKSYKITVSVDVSGQRRIGQVVVWNRCTAWVKIMKGAKSSFTIKRHKSKHNLKWRSMVNV